MRLLTPGSNNPKTAKSKDLGYLTGGLHLAPHKTSGYQACGSETPGCSSVCLYNQGRGRMKMIQEARIKKTRLFFERRDEFLTGLVKDLESLERKALKEGLKPCARLNVLSDIRWERFGIMEQFPGTTFYDYTKHKNRKRLPVNYSLTFSRSERTTDDEVREAIDHGMNVSVVFKDELPLYWDQIPVIDGVSHDLRFLDPSPCIVGLVAKGTAKKDTSGFVVIDY